MPQVLDVAACPGDRQEHINIRSAPAIGASAYLLIPDNLRSAAPAIYAHHRHNFKLGKLRSWGWAAIKIRRLASSW